VLPFGYKLSPYAFCRAVETFTRVLRIGVQAGAKSESHAS
jgi:hypothetical protein